jgi:hypothetical protein
MPIPKIIFDREKLDIVNINTVRPNTWNPKAEDTDEYRRIVESLRQNGQRLPIVVRELDGYEIIDGEQRWRGMKELKAKKILIYNEGEIDDQRARELTIAYEQQVPFDPLDLAELVADMFSQYENVKLPYDEDSIREMINLLSFDWNANYGDDGRDKDQSGEKWHRLIFRIPDSAMSVIEDELARIGSLLELDGKLNEEVKRGLILEKICVLSAQTPTKSLE